MRARPPLYVPLPCTRPTRLDRVPTPPQQGSSPSSLLDRALRTTQRLDLPAVVPIPAHLDAVLSAHRRAPLGKLVLDLPLAHRRHIPVPLCVSQLVANLGGDAVDEPVPERSSDICLVAEELDEVESREERAVVCGGGTELLHALAPAGRERRVDLEGRDRQARMRLGGLCERRATP